MYPHSDFTPTMKQTKALYQAQRHADPVKRSLEQSSNTVQRRNARTNQAVQEYESELGAALKNFPAQKKRRVLVPRTQETWNQNTRAGRATSHFYPGDKTPIFYKTTSAEIDPCNIIIAPLLGQARDSGNAVAGGYHLRVPLRSQNWDFFTPRGEKSVAGNTKTP